MARLLFLLFLILFVDTNLQSQINRKFYRLHSDNGLAQNSVWEVYQDFKGYLWISTSDGINRWDGINMIHYQYDSNDSNSLGGNSGFSFFEDNKNQLWIFHNRGVSLYDRIRDCFKNVIKTNDYCILLGQVSDHLLLIQNDNKLYKINIYTYHVSDHPLSLKLNNRFLTFYNKAVQLGDYIIFNLSPYTVFIYNTSTHEIDSLKIQSLQTKILKVNDSSCFFFSGDTLFTIHFEKSSQKIYVNKHQHENFKNVGFTCATLMDDELWLGSEYGIYVLNAKSYAFKYHIQSVDPNVNKNEFIYGFYKDRVGNFYILTNLAGLYIVSPSRNRFNHLKYHQPEYNMVKSIIKTSDGKIITGQYHASPVIYYPNGQSRTISLFSTDTENSVLSMKNMDSCNLIGITFNYIFIYNHCEDKVTFKIKHSTKEHANYPNIHQINDTYLLNVCNENSSFIFSINHSYQFDTILKLPNTILTSWCIINDSLYLLGTNKSLFIYNKNTNKQTRPIIEAWIKCILPSSRNYYLIATTGGIFVMDTNFNIKSHIGIHNGLRDQFIYGILEDDYKNYWFSHNKGITYFNPDIGEFKHYDVSDGLQSNEFNTGAYYKHDDGKLYFGGVNGINEIDPEQIYVNTTPPQLSIYQLWVDDEVYKTDTSANELSTLILPYYKNTISVDFAALDYSIPEKNSYAYYLSGVDKNWIYSGNRHFLRYANLAPGVYTLYLKGANPDGFWSEPRKLQIIIRPPFWQRTWFYIFEALIVLGIIVLVILIIRRQQRKSFERKLEIQKNLEQERIRISRDLHDNVGAQLSYLISQLDWIGEHPEMLKEDVVWNNKITSLSEAGRNAMHTLRETIWAISHQELGVEEFADRFKQYVIKMTSVKSDLQVDFHEQLLNQATIKPESALHIFRICQEAFHNAIKHSNSKKIDVYFTVQAGLFTCKIQDYGYGFDVLNTVKKDSYGLQNMKERAQEIGATFLIESTPKEGTSVSISIMTFH